MLGILLPVLQGAGSVALALVAFALAFTWPSLTQPILRLRTDGGRALAFAGLGAVLALAAALLYVTPGVLLRDSLSILLSLPVVLLWLIGTVALVVRALVRGGASRVISFAFAAVSACGVIAGMVSVALTQHGLPDTVTPTLAFLLALGALAAFVFWARAEEPEARPSTV